MITDRDVKNAVVATLGDDADQHDVSAITDEIIDKHGLVDIETIDDEEYWRIVKRHAR